MLQEIKVASLEIKRKRIVLTRVQRPSGDVNLQECEMF